jgi:hypothetical protein
MTAGWICLSTPNEEWGVGGWWGGSGSRKTHAQAPHQITKLAIGYGGVGLSMSKGAQWFTMDGREVVGFSAHYNRETGPWHGGVATIDNMIKGQDGWWRKVCGFLEHQTTLAPRFMAGDVGLALSRRSIPGPKDLMGAGEVVGSGNIPLSQWQCGWSSLEYQTSSN